MQAYSDPKRENEPHALPDIEVFHMDVREFVEAKQGTWIYDLTLALPTNPHSNLTNCGELEGWYWWFCFPGCLPDSDPTGPFTTQEEALADAQGLED